MSGIVDDLRDCTNDILGIRDDIGAELKKVYIVERIWSGKELGDGTSRESKTQILPSPRIVEFNHNLRITEGGAVKQGDILLKMISQQTLPKKQDVEFTDVSKNVEKFYEIDGRLYRPVTATERHLTWSVLVRPLSTNKE